MMGNPAMMGGGAAAPPPAEDTNKLVALSDKIDKSQSYARNEAPNYPWTNLLIGDSRLACRTDADEQLILHVAFRDTIRVQSIKLTAFSSGQSDPGESPTVVKLFVNRVNLGFEDVDDVDPTQVLNLTAADLAEDADPIKLQYVRFQRVKSITLYIEENGGADVTSIGSLRFMGRGLATTNMNEFKSQQSG
jgi:hypothetical protein